MQVGGERGSGSSGSGSGRVCSIKVDTASLHIFSQPVSFSGTKPTSPIQTISAPVAFHILLKDIKRKRS